MNNTFFPTTAKEALHLGWEQLDVVLVTGDAYVDHPSFGVAVIARNLEALGLKVGIITQPAWQDDGREFTKFGRPRFFFGVTGGNMDPMVNHYTAGRRRRSNDAFTAGGEAGKRPDYASTVYSLWLKKLYPDTPIVLGGIEASLRRFAHYDYWQDRLLPSILAGSKADLLIYGMGEKPIKELVNLLEKGAPFHSLKTIPQTAFLIGENDGLPKNKKWEDRTLSSFEDCLKDRIKFAGNSKTIEQESNRLEARRLVQRTGDKMLVVNPPFPPLSTKEMDESYGLNYTRLPHPKYRNRPPIPAYEMIKNSVTIHRGCFGACAFCTISAHQGKFISARSEKSILSELEKIASMPEFKGTVSDLGGPSANMYAMKGKNPEQCKKCERCSCISPAVCNNLDASHEKLTRLYKKAAGIKGIKHIFIGSGIRYDLLCPDFNKNAGRQDMQDYLEQLVKHHVSGRLKVAPEHTEDAVLKIMRKPSFACFEKFKHNFDTVNRKFGLGQQLVPYFISSHPGCSLQDMKVLNKKTRKLNFKLEQVQDFTPTPMTLATDIFYSGVHPHTLKPVFTEKEPNKKKQQKDCFFT